MLLAYWPSNILRLGVTLKRYVIFNLACLCFSLSQPSFSQEVPRIYKSAKLLGRGHSGLAQSTMEDAIYYNPAGLIANEEKPKSEEKKADSPSSDKDKEGDRSKEAKDVQGTAQKDSASVERTPWGFKRAVYFAPFLEGSRDLKKLSGVSGKSTEDQVALFKDIVGDSIHIGAQDIAAVMLNDMAFSLLLGVSGGLLVYKDPLHAGIETIDFELLQTTGVTGSYAYQVLEDWLTLGVTMKLLKQTRRQLFSPVSDLDKFKKFKFDDKSTGTGLGLDFAAQTNLPYFLKPKIALVVENIGDTRMRGPESSVQPVSNLLQSVNLGLGLEYEDFWGKIEGSIDRRDLFSKVEKNGGKKTFLGAQYTYDQWIGIAGGFNQGYRTLGFFVGGHYARLDLGTYTEETGEKPGLRPDLRYYMQFTGSF